MGLPAQPHDGRRRRLVLAAEPPPGRLHRQRQERPRTLHPDDGSPIIVEQGDTVRVHYVNAGYTSHPVHVHNHRVRPVKKDGGTVPEAARYDQDVVNVAPAERRTVEFEADADPGIYLLHCHKINHV